MRYAACISETCLHFIFSGQHEAMAGLFRSALLQETVSSERAASVDDFLICKIIAECQASVPYLWIA